MSKSAALATRSCLIPTSKNSSKYNDSMFYSFSYRAKDAARPRSPPLALKKRMESLPDSKHPVTVYKDGAIAKLKFGLPPEDQQIADRLEKLKT